jgi:hypothetical protein
MQYFLNPCYTALCNFGVFDYISCPISPQELALRITHAINYFEAAQAPLHVLTLPSKAPLKAATPLIKQKNSGLFQKYRCISANEAW